jgi:hypothetical protein
MLQQNFDTLNFSCVTGKCLPFYILYDPNYFPATLCM